MQIMPQILSFRNSSDTIARELAYNIITEIFAKRRLMPGELEKEELLQLEVAPHIHKTNVISS